MRRTGWLVVGLLCLWVGLAGGAADAQIDELPRPPSADSASFGVAVALHDSIAVVGASGETTCGANGGAVYVYVRRSGPPSRWVNTARLTPEPCRSNAVFGEAIALSGSRLLASASSEYFATEKPNAAYVFARDSTGRWAQTARLTAPPGRQEGSFAADVALEGDRAAVSTSVPDVSGSREGAFGGAVYVFEHEGAAGWRRTARLTASRGEAAGVLGGTVSLSDGRLAVAASTYVREEPGSVYVFRYVERTGRWWEAAILPGVESFFIDLALDRRTLLVGEERAGNDDAGVATVYTDRDSTWAPTALLRASTPYESGGFGSSMALDDPWALITGYDEQLGKEFNIDRVVYVIRRQAEGRWHQQTILDLGEVGFGAALAVEEGRALVSSVPEDRAGSVYVVQLP
jgi:hypothetical protein